MSVGALFLAMLSHSFDKLSLDNAAAELAVSKYIHCKTKPIAPKRDLSVQEKFPKTAKAVCLFSMTTSISFVAGLGVRP